MATNTSSFNLAHTHHHTPPLVEGAMCDDELRQWAAIPPTSGSCHPLFGQTNEAQQRFKVDVVEPLEADAALTHLYLA